MAWRRAVARLSLKSSSMAWYRSHSRALSTSSTTWTVHPRFTAQRASDDSSSWKAWHQTMLKPWGPTSKLIRTFSQSSYFEGEPVTGRHPGCRHAGIRTGTSPCNISRPGRSERAWMTWGLAVSIKTGRFGQPRSIPSSMAWATYTESPPFGHRRRRMVVLMVSPPLLRSIWF